MYSYFVLAEPANLIVDLSKLQEAKNIGIEFEKSCTIEEFGKYISGWKIFGYFENCKSNYIRIIEEINNQNPTVNEFKIHFWYEEDIMFYFHWDGKVSIKYGRQGDYNYFVSNELLSQLNGIFNNKSYLVYRYDIKTKFYNSHIKKIKKISEHEVTEESNKTFLFLPLYLKYNKYFTSLILNVY